MMEGNSFFMPTASFLIRTPASRLMEAAAGRLITVGEGVLNKFVFWKVDVRKGGGRKRRNGVRRVPDA